jgi:hypothetical protein
LTFPFLAAAGFAFGAGLRFGLERAGVREAAGRDFDADFGAGIFLALFFFTPVPAFFPLAAAMTPSLSGTRGPQPSEMNGAI